MMANDELELDTILSDAERRILELSSTKKVTGLKILEMS